MLILERAQEWARGSRLEPTTLEGYLSSLEQLVEIGEIATVEDLEVAAVGRFLARRESAGIAVATCNRNLTAVCSFVHWLVRQGEMPHATLFALRDLYQEEPAPLIDWLTRREFLALRRAARDVDEVLDLGVALVAGGGFRLGELRHLRHEDLELEPAVEPWLPFARVLRTHGRRVKRRRQRTTPIPQVLADELKARGLGGGREGWIFPARYETDDRIVISSRSMQSWLTAAIAETGRHCNWLTLRHTFASWLVQAGVSITKVARAMGNSVVVCEKHYAGLAPGGDADFERSAFPSDAGEPVGTNQHQ